MDRKAFINYLNKAGIGSVAAALGLGGQPRESEAAPKRRKGSNRLSKNQLRLPRDLEKLVGNTARLHKPEDLTVACYTFPNFHPSAIHNKLYGPGWTEYNLTRSARPWFEGHQQPRGPLLGELDESRPGTWEKYNELAVQHGVDVFIWDWYWYDRGPALHEALENGFLQASNNTDMKFACMWTNHPWYILFPTEQTNGEPAYPPSYPPPDTDGATAWQSLSYIISRYFHLPNYWKIDGKPVLCIWDPNRLERNIGLDATQKLFEDLRAYARSLGHKGIHFHSSGFYTPNSKKVGFNTAGSYNPLDWATRRFQPKGQEIADYEVAAADVASKIWTEHHRDFEVPYLPAVAPGWDSTPRYIPRNARPEKPNRDTWPGCTIFENESPAAFKAFVQSALAYLNQHKDVPPILTIACWNEWSEGHYLLPDNRFGYGMLDALAEALGKNNTHLAHGK